MNFKIRISAIFEFLGVSDLPTNCWQNIYILFSKREGRTSVGKIASFRKQSVHRSQKILNQQKISYRILYSGERGEVCPPNVSPSPPPSPPKKFSWKKIESYFKYWSNLTTILKNQWSLLMSRNAISANPEHYLFKIFRGSMPRTPRRPNKNFSLRCVAGKIF